MDSIEKQKINDGVGAAYHRVYSIAFKSTSAKAKQAMKCLKADLNQCSPQLLARFEKTKGEACHLKKDDEFLIHITGPWNGPVRVTDVTETSFHIVTLEGHMEAGEIHFELKQKSDLEFIFEIESLARSKDKLVNFFYDTIPIAKVMQTEMWTSFCENFVKEISHSDGQVNILTERRNKKTGQWQQV